MGNIHTVIQVKPGVLLDGAALQVKQPFRERVKEWYQKNNDRDYTELSEGRVRFPFHSLISENITYQSPESWLYLVIKSGGKSGYGDRLFDILKELAPFLEDGVLYIDDEQDGYVEVYQVMEGMLERKIVRENDSDAFSFIEHTYKSDKPVIFQLYYQRAFCESTFGQGLKNALAYIEKAIEIQPNDHDALLLAGGLYIKAKQYQQAVDHLETALNLLKQNMIIERWGEKKQLIGVADDWSGNQTRTYKLLLHNLSFALIEMENFDRATGYLNEWIHITPSWNDQTPAFLLGFCMSKLNNHEEAMTLYNQVVKQSSDRTLIANALYNLACELAKTNRKEASLHELRAAIRLNPDFEAMAKEDEDLAGL